MRSGSTSTPSSLNTRPSITGSLLNRYQYPATSTRSLTALPLQPLFRVEEPVTILKVNIKIQLPVPGDAPQDLTFLHAVAFCYSHLRQVAVDGKIFPVPQQYSLRIPQVHHALHLPITDGPDIFLALYLDGNTTAIPFHIRQIRIISEMDRY